MRALAAFAAIAACTSTPLQGLAGPLGSVEFVRTCEAESPCPEGEEDVFLTLRFSDLLESDLLVKYRANEPFFPVRALFGLLHLKAKLDTTTHVIDGFFASEDESYRLDPRSLSVRIGRQIQAFDRDDFLLDNHDVFVRGVVLADAFGLTLQVDQADLAVHLRSERELPLEHQSRRVRRQRSLVDPITALRHAPLRYSRQRRSVSGGMTDYSLSFSSVNEQTLFDISGSVGFELMGGDLTWSGRAGRDGAAGYVEHERIQWRQVFDPAPFLTQVRIGDVVTTGLRPRPLRGIHLTNQHPTPRVHFGTYQIMGWADTGWDVELYLNDRLIDVHRTDASEEYRFDLPLAYGTSQIELRTFGPNGEVRTNRRQIQIPFSMLRPGDVSYHGFVGLNPRTRLAHVQGSVGYGLSRTVTLELGLEPRLAQSRPILYSSASARVFTSYLASVTVTRGGLQRLNVSGQLPTRASIDASYENLERTTLTRSYDHQRRYQSTLFFPIELGSQSLNMRLKATHTERGPVREHRFGIHLSSRIGPFQLSSQADISQNDAFRRALLIPSISYAAPKRISRLAGSRVAARARYDVSRDRLESLELSLSGRVGQRSSLRLVGNVGAGSRLSVGLRFAVDLPFAQSSSNARLDFGMPSFTQNLRGSITWDRSSDDVYLSDRSAVGRSMVAIRLFVDADGDGELDLGEYVIQDDPIKIEGGRAVSYRRRDGIIYISDLMPYQQYTVTIDEALISNPAWLPAFVSFSFIADPHSVKQIDVPVYGAGIIEGVVLADEATVSLEGVRIRLTERTSGRQYDLATFSDGSFYQMGIAPGEYEISLDDDQLTALGLRFHSNHSTLRIRSVEGGDYAEGIILQLSSRLASGISLSE